MKLSFCTSIHPAWDLPAVTAKARDLGYDGVEVHLPTPWAGDPAAGTPLAERELVRLAFEQAGVHLAGVAAPLHFTGDRARDASTADAIRRTIDLAARVKCGKVRIGGMAVELRKTAASAAQQLADLLVPLADHAGASGVTLLLQNGLSFATARELWPVLEQADHSALAVGWDPLAAAVAGEAPSVSIPLLNSRIRQVILRDAALSGGERRREVSAFRRLGEGELSPAKLLDRLRGIGYRGWVSVAYPPPGDAPDLGPPEELLRHAIQQIKAWQPKPAKPAAPKASAPASAAAASPPRPAAARS